MSSALAKLRGQAPRPYPSLAGRGGIDSGVHRLLETPTTFTNGAPSTLITLRGIDPSLSAWVTSEGKSLALKAGTPTLLCATPHLGSLDAAIKGDGTAWYSDTTDTSFGGLSTMDVWVDGFVELGALATMAVASKRNAGFVGWLLYQDSNLLKLAITSAGPTSREIATAAIGSNRWVYFSGAINRSEASANGGQMYLEGAASGVGVDCSATADCTNDGNFEVLSQRGGLIPFTGKVAFLRIAAGAGMFADGAAGPAEWLAMHRLNWARLTGTRPLISIASATSLAAGGSTSPAYQGRVTVGVTQLHYMNAGAPRFEQRVDAAGRTFTGMLVEQGDKNWCLQSDAMATTWTAVALTSITANGQAASDGLATLDGLVGTAADTQHGVTQVIATTAVDWCLSLEVKAGDKGWVYLSDDTVANATAYFDITNGVWGTVGAGVRDKWVLYTAAGTVRAIGIVVAGTAANHTLAVYSAIADTDNAFSGDAATVNLWLGKVQWTPNDYPSSRINTTTAAVTRAADAPHRISGAAHFGPKGFTLYNSLLCPIFTPGRNHHLWTAYKAGSAATEYVKCYIDTSGKLNVVSATAGGDSGAVVTAAALNTNLITRYCVSMGHNQLRLWTRGATGGWVEATPDTAVDLVAGLDVLDFGADEAAANQAGPVLPGARYQLLDYPVLDPIPEPGAFEES